MRKNPLANRSGVYALVCTPNCRSYIGYSTNVGRRINTHLASLRRNAHANSALQADFSTYGEASFLPRLVLQVADSELGYRLEANLIKFGGNATYNVVESKALESHLRDREAAFWKRTERSGDCRLWKGKVSPQGYGVFTYYVNRKRFYVQAHRAAYFLTREDPFSSRISHACGNKLCVEPAHLLLGVPSGIAAADIPKILTFYKKGWSPKRIAKKLELSQGGVVEIVRRTAGLKTSDAITPGCLSALDIARFKSKCSPNGDCLDFLAALNSSGYPTFSWEYGGRKRNTFAHRVSYFIEHGECPDELTHLCDNPYCVNVEHLVEKTL